MSRRICVTPNNTNNKILSLFETANYAVARILEAHPETDYTLQRNSAIIYISLDALKDEYKRLLNELTYTKDKLKSKSTTNPIKKAIDHIKPKARSNTKNATETTKGYNLFADLENPPTTFKAYLNDDRILEVKTSPGTLTASAHNPDDLVSIAESAHVKDYTGNTIDTIYVKENHNDRR